MKYLLLIILVFVLGCSVRSSKVNPKKFENKVTYFKDSSSGLCFGVVAMNWNGMCTM